MGGRASIEKHPIHPMLVPFPIALWIFSLVCDVIYTFGWGGALWNEMAFYTMAGGVVGAVAAALPGLVDYFSITEPTPRKIATNHLILNATIVGMYLVNLWLRMNTVPSAKLPLVLSAISIALLGLSGWLGGELVYVHGVGVESVSKNAGAKESPQAGRRRGL
jgi:uncharacterized membrane protein